MVVAASVEDRGFAEASCTVVAGCIAAVGCTAVQQAEWAARPKTGTKARAVEREATAAAGMKPDRSCIAENRNYLLEEKGKCRFLSLVVLHPPTPTRLDILTMAAAVMVVSVPLLDEDHLAVPD